MQDRAEEMIAFAEAEKARKEARLPEAARRVLEVHIEPDLLGTMRVRIRRYNGDARQAGRGAETTPVV